mgnify:FL=1
MSIAEELRKEEREKARKEKLEMVKNLLKEGVAVDIIAKSSELSEEKIKRLQAGMKH